MPPALTWPEASPGAARDQEQHDGQAGCRSTRLRCRWRAPSRSGGPRRGSPPRLREMTATVTCWSKARTVRMPRASRSRSRESGEVGRSSAPPTAPAAGRSAVGGRRAAAAPASVSRVRPGEIHSRIAAPPLASATPRRSDPVSSTTTFSSTPVSCIRRLASSPERRRRRRRPPAPGGERRAAAEAAPARCARRGRSRDARRRGRSSPPRAPRAGARPGPGSPGPGRRSVQCLREDELRDAASTPASLPPAGAEPLEPAARAGAAGCSRPCTGLAQGRSVRLHDRGRPGSCRVPTPARDRACARVGRIEDAPERRRTVPGASGVVKTRRVSAGATAGEGG